MFTISEFKFDLEEEYDDFFTIREMTPDFDYSPGYYPNFPGLLVDALYFGVDIKVDHDSFVSINSSESYFGGDSVDEILRGDYLVFEGYIKGEKYYIYLEPDELEEGEADGVYRITFFDDMKMYFSAEKVLKVSGELKLFDDQSKKMLTGKLQINSICDSEYYYSCL